MKDLRTLNLFAKKNDLFIERITKLDVDIASKNLHIFKEFILKHQDLYPNIDKWLEKKVIPGLKLGERIAYIGFNNDIPVALAVLKLGKKSKFCHVHINDNSQNKNFGEIIFTMMTLEAKRTAKMINFTLPESLWVDKKEFFKSFGFNDVVKAKKQYRQSEEELYCVAEFQDVWQHVLQKIPKLSSILADSQDNVTNGILMSIKPEYIEKIVNSEKTMEIRRKFNKKWKDYRVVLYSSSPAKELCGHAKIDFIIEGAPDKIWGQFKDSIGGTREDFEKYTYDCTKIYAIKLKDIKNSAKRVPLWQVSKWLGEELTPPQSYISLKNNARWREAIFVSELLRNELLIETHNYK